MKSKALLKQYIYLWLALLIIIFVTSCTISNSHQAQIEVTATTVIPMVSNTPTTINQATTTATLIPTENYTPFFLTALPLPTQTPVPISSAIPTLSIEQQDLLENRKRLLQELMQNNGNCQLPCWWGIELGQNIQTIEQVFQGLNIPGWNTTTSDLSNNGLMGYIHTGYYDLENFFFYVGISLKLYAVNNHVQFTHIIAERPLRQYGEEEFVRDWEEYALDSIVQQYGKPSYVYLIPQNVADPGPPNFVLVLYYPDLGFTFSYQPFNTFSNDTEVELCLALNNMQQLELLLYNPEFVDVWANYLLPPVLNPEAEEYFKGWEWEAQTGLDLDIFYETFKDLDNSRCILVER